MPRVSADADVWMVHLERLRLPPESVNEAGFDAVVALSHP